MKDSGLEARRSSKLTMFGKNNYSKDGAAHHNVSWSLLHATSLRLSLVICIRTVHSYSLMAVSCQWVCRKQMYTRVDGSCITAFQVSALWSRTSNLEHKICVFGMHACNPVVEDHPPSISHAHQCHSSAFVDENSSCFQSCHLWPRLRCCCCFILLTRKTICDR